MPQVIQFLSLLKCTAFQYLGFTVSLSAYVYIILGDIYHVMHTAFKRLMYGPIDVLHSINTSCAQEIFLKHLRLLVEGLFGTILRAYGNPWQICPSPMLSCLMANCIERATDMTKGGSK